MKQRGLPPWDLTTSVLVAAAALALSIFQSEPIYSSVGSFLFVLALLLPGYLISIALFPRRFDLADMGRLALCIGASALLTLIFGIVLTLSSWGLSLSTLAAASAIVSLIMAPIAHFVRSPLPRWNRFVPFISGCGRRPIDRRQEAGIFQRVLDKIPMLVAAIVLVAIAYNAVNMGEIGSRSPIEDIDAPFTEFYIQGANGEDHPLLIVAGNRTTTVVRITNHELGAVNYTLQLLQNSSILSQKEITLDHDQSWEGTVDYALKDTGTLVRLDFLLYKDGDFSVPYSEDHLWFNVSSANATSEKYPETSDEGTTLDQSKKAVVLSTDMDDSKNNGDKRSSYLSKASSPTLSPVPSPVSPPASPPASSQVSSQQASQIAVKPQSGDETAQVSLQEMESELAKSSGQKYEGLQASSENASPDVAASSSTQKSEITESKEKLVATAVDIEKDVDIAADTEKDVTAAIAKEDDNPDDQKADASETDSLEMDNSKASDSAADSDEGNSPASSDEANAPEKDDADAEAPSADQEASSSNKEDKSGVAASEADQSVSKNEEAGKTSEIDSQINSWVGTRGFSKSGQGKAFTSKDIQYVKNEGSKETAVLGRQSKESARLGR